MLLNKQPGSFCAHAAEADSSYMPNVTSPLNQTALLSPHSSASYCTIRRSFSPGMLSFVPAALQNCLHCAHIG